MKGNAVLLLEIKTRMRSWRAPGIITAYLTLLGGIFLMIYYLSYVDSGRQSSEIGIQMFAILASLQFALINFTVPALTAGAISSERERQTLDMLLTTNLSPMKIIIGKLTASLSFIILLILSSLPLFSLVFLMGGVTPKHILTIFGVYLFTALFYGVLGIFYSTLIRRSQMATVLTYLTMLLQYSLTYFIPAFYREVIANGNTFLNLPFAFFFNPLTIFVEALLPGREADNLFKGMAQISHKVTNWSIQPEWLTLTCLTISIILLILSAAKLLNPLKHKKI